MKNGRKPTLAQKKILQSNGLVPDNWLVVKDTGGQLEVVSRQELLRCRAAKGKGVAKSPRTKLIGKEGI